MDFEIIQEQSNPTIVKVMGIGGAGGNAVDRMIQVGIQDVEFIAANTDMQDLEKKCSQAIIQLGPKLTQGYGSGGQWEIGEKAAEESKDEIKENLRGTDLLFITAGMGGGTGTGASPVVARIAKELNILTVGVVTKPFTFEGKPRAKIAEEGLVKLIENVDSLIIIQNNNLFKVATKQLTCEKAYELADNILRYAVQGISELLTKPGWINLDFADLSAVMNKKGKAVMSIGVGKGDNKAQDSVEDVISSPLLEEDSIEGATSMLLNITGGKDLTLAEVNQIASAMEKECDDNANIIFGHTYDMQMTDEVRVTVVATGFHSVKSSTVANRDVYPAKLEILAGKKFEKPAFQRIKDNVVKAKIGYEDKIVKEIRSKKDNTKDKADDSEPRFLINWHDENYDIPAFLRNKSKL